MRENFILRIFRGVTGAQYWEEFVIELTPFLNLTTVLLQIQKNPVNRKGERVAPVAWEQGCLEEVCGSCTVLVNGRPRQGCTTLVATLLQETGGGVILLAPLTKFPLVKDLVVDRTSMFDSLQKVSAWVDVDDARDRGDIGSVSPDVQEVRYELSTCMTCGCCLEACPQVSSRSKFIGAAAISQVRLFNSDTIGKFSAPKRLRVLMEEGGISECGNAQNCEAVCPKEIPLTESLALMARNVTKQAWKDVLGVPDS